MPQRMPLCTKPFSVFSFSSLLRTISCCPCTALGIEYSVYHALQADSRENYSLSFTSQGQDKRSRTTQHRGPRFRHRGKRPGHIRIERRTCKCGGAGDGLAVILGYDHQIVET